MKQLRPVGGTGEGERWLNGSDEDIDSGEHNTLVASPRLSILIPARNEAHQIGACVRSILVHPSPYIEVLVLDDRSEDNTFKAASLAGAGDSRLKVIRGEQLVEGWMGKSYACWQLASSARGKWLLFLDADVQLEQGALASLMDAALEQGAGMVTGFPKQMTGTWLEKLIVPMMSFTIGCHLPIRLVRTSPNPNFAAAHGACILIDKRSYRQIGGHAAFKLHLVDDVQLARAVKAVGLPLSLRDICDQVHMRMYQNASGVWNGYLKNIYAGVGRNPFLLLFILITYSTLYLIPPTLAVAGMVTGNWNIAIVALVGYFLGVSIKLAIDYRHRQPAVFCLLLPLSIIMLIALSIASWRASASGKGYMWKGRKYS